MGSINQDFVLKVERRPKPGETVTDAVLSTHNGGKGANQAAAAALLGASVALLGRVGDDGFGGPLVQALEERGVDTVLIEEAPGSATGTAFITVTEDGENSITVAPGANRRLTPEDVDAARGAIAGAAVLVAQMEVPRECVARAVEVAGEVGTRVILNLAPPFDVPRAVLEGLDPLVVNEHEAAFLLGDTVEGVEAARAAASGLLALGPKSAVVTVGADGAVFAVGEDAGHVPAPEADVVDTTGAGDAYAAGVLAALARGLPLPECGRWGSVAAAEVIGHFGARPQADLKRMLGATAAA